MRRTFDMLEVDKKTFEDEVLHITPAVDHILRELEIKKNKAAL